MLLDARDLRAELARRRRHGVAGDRRLCAARSPEATITVVAAPAASRRCSAWCGDVDEVVDDVAEEVRRGELPARTPFESALLLPNSFRIGVGRPRGRAFRERGAIARELRGALLTRAVAADRARSHQAEYYQQLVRALGFPNGTGRAALDGPRRTRATGPRASLADARMGRRDAARGACARRGVWRRQALAA